MRMHKKRYRDLSRRFPQWNYGWKSMYFITICIHERRPWFGHVDNVLMDLSEIGKVAESEWMKTFDMRKDMNLFQGEFVVMPDHFHAIIGIGYNRYNSGCVPTSKPIHCVPTNNYGPQSKNLGSIVRGFKSAVTINARKINPDFKWQPRYHDHIIRNDSSFHRISNYIKNNPGNWGR